MNLDDIFNLYEQRVLRLSLCTRNQGVLENQAFLGNAFPVYYMNGTCLFLTCDHCLEPGDLGENQNYQLDFSKRIFAGIEVNVAHKDPYRDLALLRADGLVRDLDVLAFSENDAMKTGSDIVLLAFYAKEESVLDEPGTMPGKIVGLPDTTTPNLELIRANYTAKPGASGSPVILVETMGVVGVHREGESAAKYAVSAQSVKAALRVWSGSEEGVSMEQMLTEIAYNI